MSHKAKTAVVETLMGATSEWLKDLASQVAQQASQVAGGSPGNDRVTGFAERLQRMADGMLKDAERAAAIDAQERVDVQRSQKRLEKRTARAKSLQEQLEKLSAELEILMRK